jgi:penicillin G amidase
MKKEEKPMMPRRFPFRFSPSDLLPAWAPVVATALALAFAVAPAVAAPVFLPGLDGPVRVVRDAENAPHIYASSDVDAMFALGWVHAEDRFFQMDFFRRAFSGRLAELLGEAALASDVELRTLGLRRAAEATIATAPPQSRAWFQAYANGVNAWLARNPLPPEYALLELTGASVPRWEPADSAVIGKAIAFQLSFDLDDIDRTIALATYQAVGALAGFDGQALFFEDLFRSAPLDKTVSIPGALPGASAAAHRGSAGDLPLPGQKAVELARRYRARAAAVPALRSAFQRAEGRQGSNWWLVSGRLSATGAPMLANDPHLGLDMPPIFHEAHVMSFSGNRQRPMIASGIGFAGAPAVVLGCNLHICWGATTNPMDVTDVYVEELVLDPATGLPTHTRFRGELEPLVLVPQVFRVNPIGDGTADNLADAGVGPLEGGLTLIVPRRNNGPIVAVDAGDPANVTALSVQYTGFGPTRELDTFRLWMRASNLVEFKAALQFFDVGSQNWAYADRLGNIAYFTSAEMPLREDLQTLSRPDGLPPYFLRDGTGALRNEWLPLENPQPGQAIPFEVLPFEEMPQVVNPPQGFILNANNDPVGTTNDNNPLNQLRPGGGLYYLSPGYADLRSGRIEQLLTDAAAAGPISVEDLAVMQANNQLLDAEILVPHLRNAFERATADGAWPGLAAAASGRVAAAISFLENWDFSTPTGIHEGYDPFDDPRDLPAPTETEIAYSVAATIYSVWRGQMIEAVIDDLLAAIGLGDVRPGSNEAFRAMAHQLEAFDTLQGVGASGIDFFPVPGAPTREDARDLVILSALGEALDLLASNAFAPAFGNSVELRDYRWGKLHRIVFDHPLGPLSVPPAGPFEHLAPGLPGISKAGGFGAVDASSHNPRADSVHELMFGSGPARRFLGVMLRRGIEARQIIPGGESGNPLSPFYTNQLGRWLTNHYHPMWINPRDVGPNGVSIDVLLPMR